MIKLTKKIIRRFFFPQKITFEDISFHDVKKTNILRNIWTLGKAGFEPEVIHFFKTYPFNFKTFMDCGANIGMFSALIEKNHADKKIIAFEPFPKNINYLEQLKKRNNLSFKIESVALSDHTDNTELYVPEEKSASILSSSASIKNTDERNCFTVNVQVEPFSKFCALLGEEDYPLLIKMDIEGSEWEALRSIEDFLKTKDIDIVVEILIQSPQKQEVFDFLTNCGYEGYLITNSGLLREDRPITLAAHTADIPTNRSIWKNHYFTKKPRSQIEDFSKKSYKHFI